jgi:hypothetical protein
MVVKLDGQSDTHAFLVHETRLLPSGFGFIAEVCLAVVLVHIFISHEPIWISAASSIDDVGSLHL